MSCKFQNTIALGCYTAHVERDGSNFKHTTSQAGGKSALGSAGGFPTPKGAMDAALQIIIDNCDHESSFAGTLKD